jgi:hypothetical protein
MPMATKRNSARLPCYPTTSKQACCRSRRWRRSGLRWSADSRRSSGPGAGSALARWLLAHTSGSQVRLQVVADQAGSKHAGDSRNRGKGGQPAWPVTTPDRRRHGDAHVWRQAGASALSGRDPIHDCAHMGARYGFVTACVRTQRPEKASYSRSWPHAREATPAGPGVCDGVRERRGREWVGRPLLLNEACHRHCWCLGLSWRLASAEGRDLIRSRRSGWTPASG